MQNGSAKIVIFFLRISVLPTNKELIKNDINSFPGCQGSLGVSAGLIKDSQITASSSYDEHHQPYHARLNKTVKGSRGGWCSAFADETEFLEVNLVNKTTISGKLL